MKQALEWVVADVERLSRFIESETDLNAGDEQPSVKDDDQSFEILSQSPLLGDGKFKLEIGTPPTHYDKGNPDVIFHSSSYTRRSNALPLCHIIGRWLLSQRL